MIKMSLLFFVVGSFFMSTSYAGEINRLFLTPEQRQVVEAERQSYLKRHKIRPVENNFIVTTEKKPEAKPRISLPSHLSVSAVIITPDGRKLVRVNERYNALPKKTKLDEQQTSLKEVGLKVDGKLVEIPLGETYLPRSGKTVKSYQYHQQAKRKPLMVKQEVKTRQETTDTLVKDIQKLQALTGGLSDTAAKP